MGNWKIENKSTMLYVNQSARVFSLDRSLLWAIFFYTPFSAKICPNVLSADIICFPRAKLEKTLRALREQVMSKERNAQS